MKIDDTSIAWYIKQCYGSGGYYTPNIQNGNSKAYASFTLSDKIVGFKSRLKMFQDGGADYIKYGSMAMMYLDIIKETGISRIDEIIQYQQSDD